MPRDFATIQTSIWGNPEIRKLPLEHQGLYLQLWTHPDLNYAGVLDWRPGRNIAPLSAGSTADSVRALIPLLEEHLFVIVDEDTEELLLRSYFRHDNLLKNPKTAVSMANAYAGVGSNMIRGVIVHELLRLKGEHPEWRWESEQVQRILKHPAIDPRSLHPTPSVTPSVTGSVTPSATGYPTPSVTPFPTTTATTTSTDAAHLSDDEGESDPPKSRSSRLPASWAPTAEHLAAARARGVDVVAEAERFRLHAEANDRRAVRWNAAFSMWLTKAVPTLPAGGTPVDPAEAWMRDRS